jgi:murein L,D-transpeptidase YafK
LNETTTSAARKLGLVLSVAALLLQACGHSAPAANPEPADKIIISKSAHTLSLLKGARVLSIYKVAIGRDAGAKTCQGDHKTPEGDYIVDAKKNASRFHRALHISYPNQADRTQAQKAGCDPGGDIEIHGLQNGLGWIGSLHRHFDWTDGCVAVTDSEIDQICDEVAVGTPVEIQP